MATLVNNPAGDIVGHGDSAERADAQGETGLIKVTSGGGFYYIGTNDRDTYIFVENVEVPSDFGPVQYTYINGAFVAKPA